MMDEQTHVYVSVISGCISVISALVAFMAIRHVKRIDRHGIEINGIQITVQKLDTMMAVIKQQSDLQAIEMKGFSEKLTTFIIDYHKASRIKNRI